MTYKLQLPPAWTIHDIFHASLLTPYHITEQKGANYLRPPLKLVDGEEEFEVENVLGHRYFSRRHKLQYLIKWKGYPMADNIWEPVEQVFAPTKVQAYHRVHPMERPWPHKRTRGASVRPIGSCFPCQTPPHPRVRKSLPPPAPFSLRPQKSMRMPSNPQLPQRYHLRSRLKKIKTCPSDPSTPKPIPFTQFPPSRPYQSSGHMQQGRHKSKSKRSLGRSPPPSKGENVNSRPANSDSEKGMSRRSQIQWVKKLSQCLAVLQRLK